MTSRRNSPAAIKRLLAMRLAMTASVGVLAALLLLWIAGAHDSGKTGPTPRLALASGVLSTNNAKNGSAILTASGLLPGAGGINGSVQITNTGDLAGDYTLSESNINSPTGPGGGQLKNGLHLTIFQDPGTGASKQIYSGSLGGVGSISLGNWGGGESHTYQFWVSFPSTGSDNSFQSAHASVEFDWTATAPEPPAPNNGGTTTVPSGGGVTGASTLLTVAGSSKQLPLKQHNLIYVTARCAHACSLVANGTLSIPGGAAKVYKLPKVSKSLSKAGKVTLKLKIPKKALAALKKAFAKKKSGIAKIAVVAKSGGSSTKGQRTIVLKK